MKVFDYFGKFVLALIILFAVVIGVMYLINR